MLFTPSAAVAAARSSAICPEQVPRDNDSRRLKRRIAATANVLRADLDKRFLERLERPVSTASSVPKARGNCRGSRGVREAEDGPSWPRMSR